MCAALYAAGGTACSSSPPNLPPIEASGNPGASCALGNACQGNGSYCIATGQACKDLECVGGTWQCPPDGSVILEAGVDATDAAGSADAADASDGASAADAPDAAAESGKGDASAD